MEGLLLNGARLFPETQQQYWNVQEQPTIVDGLIDCF